MRKDYKSATKGGVLEGADFMNIAVVPSSYTKKAKPAPRPGTREPEMSEDELIDMLHQKLGPNFGAAMSVPMHQWGGEFKKMSKKMKQRIKAVQSLFNEMKEQGLTTAQMADDDTEDIVL
tara:strand:+ start:4217 stop:4576 length:360 start_codon:yes stop_codon:yes gene_type:complete